MRLIRPSIKAVNKYLTHVKSQPLSYSEVGATKDASLPRGYVHDSTRSRLGTGNEVFDRACVALQNWRMFDLRWILLAWPETPIETGAVVAPIIHFGGVWWPNACRIVYVVNEELPRKQFGFAYGTLLEHMCRGEELFLVEMLLDDSVWFEIRAFSRPAKFLSKVARQLVRYGQQRFFADAHTAMEKAVNANRTSNQ